jgi:hypothetical protein
MNEWLQLHRILSQIMVAAMTMMKKKTTTMMMKMNSQRTSSVTTQKCGSNSLTAHIF